MKHWIFDFDGTLVDTDGLFYKVLGHALEPFSVKVGENFMEEIRHKHPHRIFEDLLPADKAEEAMHRMRIIGQEISQNIKPFDGIERVLRTLEKNKVSLSIWTGRDGSSTDRILKNTGLRDYFEHIISGTCVETNKPGHDGLLELKMVHSAETDEMVMTGDHHHDIEPANALGVLSIHARWKKDPHVLPEKVKPNYEFGCTDKFHEWILNKI